MTAPPPKIITDIEALALDLHTKLNTLRTRRRSGYMSQKSLEESIVRARKAFRAELIKLCQEAK